MEFNYFVGVDVSKNTLDFAVYNFERLLFHKKTANSLDKIDTFVTGLKKLESFSLSSSVFCMEFTGIYNNHLIAYLSKKKGNIWMEPASHIKASLGNIRGKNDKLDAIRIGKFAYKNREEARLWKPKREVMNKLKQLTVLRDRLIDAKNSLAVPLQEINSFMPKPIYNQLKKACQRSLNSLQADIEKIEKAIAEIVKTDQKLDRLFGIVTSVQGVGTQTAVNMIITTNGFEDIKEAKKFACYSGVAPFSRESGLYKGRAKVSHMANKKMKTLLHMAALSAITCNEDMKQYYNRKVEEGKNKMCVINAVRNKIIHRIFACVAQNRKYEKSYITTLV